VHVALEDLDAVEILLPVPALDAHVVTGRQQVWSVWVDLKSVKEDKK